MERLSKDVFVLNEKRGVSVSTVFMKDEYALISLNLFNFLNTFHCIRAPDFTSIFKLGTNMHFVGNRFHIL